MRRLANSASSILRAAWATDSARYYFLHKAVAAASAPATAAVVIHSLSSGQQGFYFTMLSLTTLLLVSEFGLGSAITHFVSHEASRADSDAPTDADDKAIGRLAGLARVALTWTLIVGIGSLILLSAAGHGFLAASTQAATVSWEPAWWLMCLALPLSLLASVGRSFAEGLGDVACSQRSLLWSTVAAQIITWAALAAGLGLLALALGQWAMHSTALILLRTRLSSLLQLARHPSKQASFPWWRREFWPHQWRLGISWTCGLLTVQSFVPAVFHARGPVEAGQAGMLIYAYGMANVFGHAWITVRQATVGRAWLLSDESQLRQERRQTTVAACWTTGAAGLSCIALFAAAQWTLPELATRLGSMMALTLLMLAATGMQSTHVDMVLVRLSKREPFLTPSIAYAAAVCISNWLLAPLGIDWVFGGFAVISLGILVPWVRSVASSALAQIGKNSTSQGQHTTVDSPSAQGGTCQ